LRARKEIVSERAQEDVVGSVDEEMVLRRRDDVLAEEGGWFNFITVHFEKTEIPDVGLEQVVLGDRAERHLVIALACPEVRARSLRGRLRAATTTAKVRCQYRLSGSNRENTHKRHDTQHKVKDGVQEHPAEQNHRAAEEEGEPDAVEAECGTDRVAV
jgi:hypothetical protein